MKKHQLVEADIVAHEDRIKDMNDQADSLVESGQFDSSDILEKRDLISTRYKHIQAALWNRNRNFLTSGTGTGTVINYGSRTGTRYKNYVFDFLHLKFFPFTFYHKFVEIYKPFPCKTAYHVKRQKKFQNFILKICFIWARYGAGT